MIDLLDKARWAIDYAAYRKLLDTCVAEGRTTGTDPTEKRIAATRVNQARMRRWERTLVLDASFRDTLIAAPPQLWIVLTEVWCGDSAQNLPAIMRMAEVSPVITLRFLLRDEHPDVMDRYLTNGSRSIPRLIALNNNGTELFTWGPRPAPAQTMVMENRGLPAEERLPYEVLSKNLHRWYVDDACRTVQAEFDAPLRAPV